MNRFFDIPELVFTTSDVNPWIEAYKDYTNRPKPQNIEVSNVKTIYHDGQPVGVKVYFADGTDEKAICEEGDRQDFNLDFGITICLCKKLMGGSHAYNQKMHQIRKEMERRAYASAIVKQAERQAKQERHERKMKEAKRKRDAREREIEIQKEAYLRALRELRAENGVDMEFPDHG